MKKYLILLSGLAAVFIAPVQAASTNGTIGVSLTLTNGCLVNGSGSQNGITFGRLNFGEQPATFETLTARLSEASNGGAAIGVQCTTSSYSVLITGNNNTATPSVPIGIPGATARYMRSASNSTQGVAYSLYSDGSFSNEIANNTTLARSSSSDGVDYYTLYGRVRGGGNSVAVAPGVYTDTINVSVVY